MKAYKDGDKYKGVITRTYDSSKITKVGSPTVTDDGIASGFSSSSYVKMNEVFSPGSNNWCITIKFTTGSSVTTQQGLVGGAGTQNGCTPFYIIDNNLTAFLSSNGTSWNITQKYPILTLSTNTTYIVKCEFNGSSYIWSRYENNAWTVVKTLQSSEKVYSGLTMQFGTNRGQNNPFTGSIDLKQFSVYINGREVYSPTNKKVRLFNL